VSQSPPSTVAAKHLAPCRYVRDLFALRERLVADFIDFGEIVDGSPGPSAEMRLEDPDGYILMIAQIEPVAALSIAHGEGRSAGSGPPRRPA
jgi:hypothetical protein